jgi:ABC-type multidrug transport system fused ATPase/permease subunit
MLNEKSMESWLTYLKRGLSRTLPKDRIAGKGGYAGVKENLKNLRPFFVRHWRKGVMGVFLVALATVLNFPQPLILRYLIDRVFLDRQLVLLAGAILLLAGLSLFEKLANVLQRFYFTRFEQTVILDIQQDLLDRALRFPKSFFDENETGYLMSRLSSDVQGIQWFFSGTVVFIVTNLLRFIGGVAFLFYLEWRIAIGVLVILPGLVLCVRYFSRRMHVLIHQGMEQRANVTSRFQESLSSVPLIKAFSSEKRALSRLMSEMKSALQISLEQSTVGSVANLVINSMPSIARGVVLALGGYWVIKGDWSLGSLLAFEVYLGYVFGPAQYLASANLDLQNALASLERVSALYNIFPEENMDVGQKVDRLKGEIEFKNVSFSYAGREPVLKDVSFHVRPGEHVAIVGPSGVGKTTLISLILRFYKPTSGEVFFDGRPASDLEVGSLRRRIGYVPQQLTLFAGTIMENLRYGNPEASDAQVHRAARVAGVHDFICGLPSSYETQMGEKGVRLSEGEKQRLSIARALIKEPDVFVLDEPTSAVDSLTEKPIFDSLPGFVRDKTLFVVAHQLSTIKGSDRILLLNESRLVAVGTHPSLLETNDYYRSLVASRQMK